MTTRFGSLLSCSLAALAMLQTACDLRSNKAAARAASSSAHGAAIAFASGNPISLAEVDSLIANDLYTMRTMALRGMLAKRLVEDEARRRGIDEQRLLDLEVDGKVVAPSDAELREFFENAQRQGRIEADERFDDVKDSFRVTRMNALRQDREYAFFQELSARADVRVDLEGLGRPHFETREAGPAVGAADAPIVLVEYIDFKSRFAPMVQPVLERLIAEYPKVLRVVFRQKPNGDDEDSMRAADAALCAAEQGLYWEFRKTVLANRGNLSEAALLDYAKRAGLDGDALAACLRSGRQRPAVAQDLAEAEQGSMEGSPVFSLNGTRLSGAHEFGTFKDLIDTELRWVAQSPTRRSKP